PAAAQNRDQALFHSRKIDSSRAVRDVYIIQASRIIMDFRSSRVDAGRGQRPPRQANPTVQSHNSYYQCLSMLRIKWSNCLTQSWRSAILRLDTIVAAAGRRFSRGYWMGTVIVKRSYDDDARLCGE